jgi:predicted transcriptional regulator/transcriptional regulator with XRE-family HTH domain
LQMANRKLFIGRKVREVREKFQLTQAAFAEKLGISASYLNQIENSHRSVSASVLLALVERFRFDISSISESESDRLLSALSEALADPVFKSHVQSLQDLKLVTQNAPALAHALIACHQAYQRSSEQLASLDNRLEGAALQGNPSPYDEVRDFFHFVDNYVDTLDRAAEKLAGRLGLPDRDVSRRLEAHLDSTHGIRIGAADPLEPVVRRYDHKTRILVLDDLAPSSTRAFQMAFQIGALEARSEVDQTLARARFRTPQSAEICRIGLYNYFAGALLLPYGAFRNAAQQARHDLELMSARFGASLEQVAHRLSTLQRSDAKGVPVFFARIDRAGNITKRHSAARLQFARFGSACPLWNVHGAFESPGRIIRQLAETPDGARYLCVATEIVKPGTGFSASRPRFAIALGCEVTHAQKFVYADGLGSIDKAIFDPIGISCRICERHDCFQRAIPPLNRVIAIDHDQRRQLPYSFS